MTVEFGSKGIPTTAKIEATLPDGGKYLVDMFVHKLESRGSDFYDSRCLTIYGNVKECTFVLATTGKEENPVKEKKPTVKSCVDRVQKATVAHAKLTKKIFEAEHTLTDLKGQKLTLDVELKTAREQLLAVAGA